MKILYVTTIGGTMCFFKNLIKELLDNGHMVDIASNIEEFPVPDEYMEWGCRIFSLSCSRTPLRKENLKTIGEIRDLVKENQYDIVHCHTPIAAVCTRIACRKIRKRGTRVIYTAHGFQFYIGASIKNWIMYFSVELLCSYWTDVLITINQEDYTLAQKKMKAKCVEYVPGVGIDIKKFANILVDRKKERIKLAIPENAAVLLSVGELNRNKNHEAVIHALKKIDNKNIHYVIAGCGDLEDYLRELTIKLGLEEQIHLIGFCNNVSKLYKIADLYVHPSIREGLPMAVMEAIAAKIPIICSDIRGCRDLVDRKCLFRYTEIDEIINCIKENINGSSSEMVEKNYLNLQNFDSKKVISKMFRLYFLQ